MVNYFCSLQLVSPRREAPAVLSDFFNGDPVAVGAFFALRPLGEYVRNIVSFNGCAFVVEAESVGGDVVEPNRLRRSSLFEDKRGGRDTCVGLEHSAG